VTIEGSVGLAGRNYPIDVAVVQKLLIDYFTQIIPVKGRSSRVITPSIVIDGECSQALIDLIKEVQTTALGQKKADDRIDPGGRTFAEIVAQINTAVEIRDLLFGPAPGHTGLLPKINPQRFRKFYIRQRGDEKKKNGLGLTVTKGEELLVFFNFLQNDPDIQDIRWATYMLATAHHETSASFKASTVENGKGGKKSYAIPKTVTDTLGCRGPKNATYNNTYYGRGYVQLTWKDNYKAIGKAYGIGDELYINPDRAHEPAIAYFAATYGMRHGLFTNGVHKLSTHIQGKNCSYKNARQIINGTDNHVKIAEHADRIEILLRLCVQ
jgi:hypothetical protein